MAKAESENQTGTLTIRESAQPDLELKAGWPRKFLPTPRGYRNAPDKLPVSWLETEHNIAKGEWALYFDGRSCLLIAKSGFKLCDICGEEITGKFCYGVDRHSTDQHYTTLGGNALHPRCALLTVKFCPRFRKLDQTKLDQSFVVADQMALDIPASIKESRSIFTLADFQNLKDIPNDPLSTADSESDIFKMAQAACNILLNAKVDKSKVKQVTVQELKSLAQQEK